MAVALHGNLKDFGLADVFQLIGQQRKTGVLEISSRKSKMRLYFADGSVVTASPEGKSEHAALGEMMVRCGLLTAEDLTRYLSASEQSARPLTTVVAHDGRVADSELESIVDLLTQDTIFQVLRWTKGSFHFSARAVAHDRPPEKLLGAEQILMDGLRMVDEWQTFAGQVPSGDACFERAAPLAAWRESHGADARRAERAERIYQLVDGRLSARRIIDLSRLGTFEGTRALAELRQCGAIALMEPRRARKLLRGEKSRRPWGEQIRWLLASVVPVALLAVLTAAAWDGRVGGLSEALGEAQPARGLEIPRNPFEAARQSFEKRRLRNAAEAHRMLHGAWPESLSDIEPSMAGQNARSYYYAAGERGVVVLSPQR